MAGVARERAIAQPQRAFVEDAAAAEVGVGGGVARERAVRNGRHSLVEDAAATEVTAGVVA